MRNLNQYVDVSFSMCDTLKTKTFGRAANSIGTWELGSQKIFSFAGKFVNKSFLTQVEDDFLELSAKKTKFFVTHPADHNPE